MASRFLIGLTNDNLVTVAESEEPEPEPCSESEIFQRLIRNCRPVTSDCKELIMLRGSESIGVYHQDGELFDMRPNLTKEGLGLMPSEDEQRELLEALRERIWGRKRR